MNRLPFTRKGNNLQTKEKIEKQDKQERGPTPLLHIAMSMFVRKGGHNSNNNNNQYPGNFSNTKPKNVTFSNEKLCGHNTCLLTTKQCCSCSDTRPKNARYTSPSIYTTFLTSLILANINSYNIYINPLLIPIAGTLNI